MSKIVSITRLLNEGDIVEAFVRHHEAHLDQMLFLDHGSTDRTLEILRALQAEGFALKLFQSFAASFDEIGDDVWSYQVASQILGADWVVFLDADEFIATPNAVPLATLLPAAHKAACIGRVVYGQSHHDNPAETVIPWRQRWRSTQDTKAQKIILRASLPNIVVESGHGAAFSDGQKLDAMKLPHVALAHYPRRNGWQFMQKICTGWLGALAAGRNGLAHAGQYLPAFETLREKPWEILRNPDYFAFVLDRFNAVEDPLAYLGGPLQYWQESDPAMQAAQLFLHFAERLAAQHGQLVDQSPQARALVESWNSQRNFLF